MGSKARRTALSVAGIALAGGASLALAAPASASTHTGQLGGSYDAGYQQSAATAGTYSKVEKTTLSWNTQSATRAHQGGWHNDCDDHCGDPGCRGGCDDGYRGGYHWRSGSTRVVGFYRTYRECREAARRGGWDNYDCDFTRRGYRGWHQSWNRWGANDWRCHGSWVLTVGC
jgi:hypothetical protein